MERVYLLLRNNQQSGPFTIGELLQQQLRSSDMIWIEGKSTAWTYLSELELIPFAKKTDASNQTQSTKTSDEIEKKAEELRQKILSASPKTYFPNYTTEIETYSSPHKLEDEIEFIDYRKKKRIKKNTALGELLLTCVVIGLFVVGIYKGKSFLGARHKVQNSVATQLNSGDQHTAKKNMTNIPVVVNRVVIDTTKHADSLLAMQKAKQKSLLKQKAITDSLNAASIAPATTNTANQENKKEEPVTQSPPQIAQQSAAKKEDTPVKKEVVPSVPVVKSNNEPVKEEKRGFLRGLFKKKKKEDASSDKTDQ